MNLKEFHTKYGTQITEELLDFVYIRKNITRADAREFAVRIGVVTRATKLVHPHIGISWTGKPYIKFSNGRNETKLLVTIEAGEIERWRENAFSEPDEQ